MMNLSKQRARTPRAVMVGLACAFSLTLAGCAGSYGANERSSAGVGQASTVHQATVVSVREVNITKDYSIIGGVTGAVLGGIAGSEIGQGDKAETAGAIGGAVLGGVAGNEAGKAINKRPGYAYVVQFDNDEIKEIVQGADNYMAPGTRVNVTYGMDRVTVSPANSSR